MIWKQENMVEDKMELVNCSTSIQINYGQVDIYYPIKFGENLNFQQICKKICESPIILTEDNIKKYLKREDNAISDFEVDMLTMRNEFLEIENEKARIYFGNEYTSFFERFLLMPLKIRLCSDEIVWLHAMLYVFKNNMGILRLELPLLHVDNIPLKTTNWDMYIKEVECLWKCFVWQGSKINEIRDNYFSIINVVLEIPAAFYGNELSHIMLIDYEGNPDDINNIPDEVQVELFRTIMAPVVDAPYTSYIEEAKNYLLNNTWGKHNVRCILKSTGGCLSFLEKKVQEYWTRLIMEETGEDLTREEYINVVMQLTRDVQSNVEFPYVVLLLKKINILDEITKKDELDQLKGEIRSAFLREKRYQYLENIEYICSIQEGCCGTVSEQCEVFEKMMPYYVLAELTNTKQGAINEILYEKEREREERFQNFVAIGSLLLALVFGLPAIYETFTILRGLYIMPMVDIPYISIKGISTVVWLVMIGIIFIRISRFKKEI